MANTIQDKLAYLEETKEAIKQSIIAKGVSVSDSDTFRSYADKINNIESGGGTTNYGTLDLSNEDLSGYVRINEKIKKVILPSDLSKITNLSFKGLGITYINLTGMDNVSSLDSCFSECRSLSTAILPNSLPNVNNIQYLFGDCSSLTNVTLPMSMPLATYMSSLFTRCSSLIECPMFDTSAAQTMDNFFSGCGSLTTIPLLDLHSATSMRWFFENCYSLKTIPQLDTSNVEQVDYMFSGSGIMSVPLLDFTNVTTASGIFLSCTSLQSLQGFKGLKVDIDISASLNIGEESVISIINEAEDMSGNTKTIKLSTATYQSLNPSTIELASTKGWNLASA